MIEGDTIISSNLSIEEQYELVCNELEEGRHDKVLPICLQMGHNHTMNAEGNKLLEEDLKK